MDLNDEANPVADEDVRVDSAEGAEPEVIDQGDELEQQYDPETGEPIEANPEEEEDELDLDGEKVKLPKNIAEKVKAGTLRMQDYTRKTTELAEQRKATEAQKAAQEELFTSLREDIGQVTALKHQLKAFEGIEWGQLDPQTYHRYRVHEDQLKRELTTAEAALNEKEAGLKSQREQSLAKARQEAAAVLAKDIPNWGADTARQVIEHGIETYGLTPDEAREMVDPRLWKMLHDNRSMKAELTALKSKQAKATAVQASAAVKPAAPTKGSFAGAGVHDKLPAAEWVRRRNAELAKRAGR